MDDRRLFGICSSDSIDGRQLPHAECCDDSPNALNPGIAIRCISCIQLIAVADPVEASWLDVVQGGEVVVTRDAVDTSNADLVQAPEQIFSKADLVRHGGRCRL